MEKLEHVESQVIRDLVLKNANCDPFSDDFNLAAFKEILDKRINELTAENINISRDNLLKYVSLFKEFNDTQNILLDEIEMTNDSSITNAFGEEIDATGAMDITNDSANLAIKFNQSYNRSSKIESKRLVVNNRLALS